MPTLAQIAARFLEWRNQFSHVRAVMTFSPINPTCKLNDDRRFALPIHQDRDAWSTLPSRSWNTAVGTAEVWIDAKASPKAEGIFELLDDAGVALMKLHRSRGDWTETREAFRETPSVYWLYEGATDSDVPADAPRPYVVFPSPPVAQVRTYTVGRDGVPVQITEPRLTERCLQMALDDARHLVAAAVKGEELSEEGRRIAAIVGDRPAWWIKWDRLFDDSHDFAKRTDASPAPTFRQIHPDLAKQAVAFSGQSRRLIDLILDHGGEVSETIVGEREDWGRPWDANMRQLLKRTNDRLQNWRIARAVGLLKIERTAGGKRVRSAKKRRH